MPWIAAFVACGDAYLAGLALVVAAVGLAAAGERAAAPARVLASLGAVLAIASRVIAPPACGPSGGLAATACRRPPPRRGPAPART